MRVSANSEDTDKKPRYATFHQYLHSLLRRDWNLEKEIEYYLEIIFCAHLIYYGSSKVNCIERESRIHYFTMDYLNNLKNGI